MKMVRVALGVLLGVMPGVVFAAPRTLSDLANLVASLIDTAVFVLISFAIVLYFYGMDINITNFKDDKEKRKQFFVYGLLAIFVMVSIWGIVALVKNTIFPSAFVPLHHFALVSSYVV